jgi:hypothetical protein
MYAVIYIIMHCLDIESDRDEEIDAYGIIDGCIKDGDSFEYMMKVLGTDEERPHVCAKFKGVPIIACDEDVSVIMNAYIQTLNRR